MPVDPIGFDQYNFDSVKWIYQDPIRNVRPVQVPDHVTKKFEIDPPKKSEKSEKEKSKKDPKDDKHKK